MATELKEPWAELSTRKHTKQGRISLRYIADESSSDSHAFQDKLVSANSFQAMRPT